MGANRGPVMLDYRTLPFISSPNPIWVSLRPLRRRRPSAQDRDVEAVVYGWSRPPSTRQVRASGPFPTPSFSRSSNRASRSGPCSNAARRSIDFLNDRSGIYASATRVITWFGHLVNLADSADAGRRALFLVGGATLFSARRRALRASGRAASEIDRASIANCSSRSWPRLSCRSLCWPSPRGRIWPTSPRHVEGPPRTVTCAAAGGRLRHAAAARSRRPAGSGR